MKKLKLLIIILIPLLLLLSVFTIKVTADSGWDTDYSSGHSSDYGSGGYYHSHYSSSDYSSHNYRSSGSSSSHNRNEFSLTKFLLIIVVSAGVLTIIALIAVILDSKYNKNNNNGQNGLLRKDISEEEANKLILDFNIEEFKTRAYDMFKNIQNYWMDFDYDNLKKNVTDELYNTYYMQLETLKPKNQKNIMSDFELEFINLTDLKKENNQFIATVSLGVSFKDYVVDLNNNVVRGNKNKKVNNVYILTFVRSVDSNKNNACPKCGAEVSGNTTGVCQYCNSKIIFDEYDWVMSKKQKISQR